MNYLFKTIFFLVIIFFCSFGFSGYSLAQTGESEGPYFNVGGTYKGLVHCGHTSSYENRCTLCDLIVGIQRIIKWGMQILVVVALVAIVGGAIMYIISAGNSGMMESAKTVIKQALWGVVIVLGAWVIVNTILWMITSKLYPGTGESGNKFMDISNWYNFDCKKVQSGGDSQEQAGGTSQDSQEEAQRQQVEEAQLRAEEAAQRAADAERRAEEAAQRAEETDSAQSEITPLSEQEVRSVFSESGISINNNACNPGQTSGCTDVGGLREYTISSVVVLRELCGASCEVVITGGSEGNGIHNESGTYNHINGYKVDLRPNPELNNYIETTFTKIPEPRSDGAIGYRDSSGNTYYLEGNHWDVTYYGT
ncbi:MAG: hypothetical protein V3574_02300 [Candidatus Moraniibacteriota bacterium]